MCRPFPDQRTWGPEPGKPQTAPSSSGRSRPPVCPPCHCLTLLLGGGHSSSPSGTRLLPWSPALSARVARTPLGPTHRSSCPQQGPLKPVVPVTETCVGGGGPKRAHLFQKEQWPSAAREARPRHLWLTAVLIGVSFPLDSLLAGIPQKVKFTVTTGHYTVKSGDSLQLSNAEAMLVLCPADSRAVIYSNTRGGAASPAVLGRHRGPLLPACPGPPAWVAR